MANWQEEQVRIRDYFLKDKNWSHEEKVRFFALALAGEAGEIRQPD